MTVFDILRERLAKAGQEHLLKFWDELNFDEQRQLCEDIEQLDLMELKTYFDRATASLSDNGSAKLDDRLQPIPNSKLFSLARTSEDKIEQYRNEGLRQISQGHVGVLLMAGGQGKITIKKIRFSSILLWIT